MLVKNSGSDLFLNGLTQLSPDEARYLFQWQGNWICLNGVKKLAGAIAHNLRDVGSVRVRCFGNASMGKAAKSLAIARGYVAVNGLDLYCPPHFITEKLGGEEKTGIEFHVFAGGDNAG